MAFPTPLRLYNTLTNRGEDAYEPETYGDLVTVERTINLKGGYNGFKLLDANGVERSRQRKDLSASPENTENMGWNCHSHGSTSLRGLNVLLLLLLLLLMEI